MAHDSEPTAERLWDDVSGRLREALNETTYATWFGDVAAGELADDTFFFPNVGFRCCRLK